MIRIILALIAVFIIWVLFFSKFTKERKIVIVALVVVVSFLGVWYESSVGKPRLNIVEPSQIINCGVSAEHSYRTNFDINLCVQNTSEFAKVKRLELSIIAQQCTTLSECIELQRVVRDLSVELTPNSSIMLKQNLSFNNVAPDLEGVKWSFIVNAVKASK